jgi:hypothetical protein
MPTMRHFPVYVADPGESVADQAYDLMRMFDAKQVQHRVIA